MVQWKCGLGEGGLRRQKQQHEQSPEKQRREQGSEEDEKVTIEDCESEDIPRGVPGLKRWFEDVKNDEEELRTEKREGGNKGPEREERGSTEEGEKESPGKGRRVDEQQKENNVETERRGRGKTVRGETKEMEEESEGET